MSNITDSELEKLAEKEYPYWNHVATDRIVDAARRAFVKGYKAALQNKVNNPCLLELVRKVTDILEGMDLKDSNRNEILKIKMGLQAILQEKKVSDISAEDELHQDSEKLLKVCFEELRLKMIKSQKKYGWSNEWLTQDWEDECCEQMIEHLQKGDPRDVAVYAMFMIYRGWTTNKKSLVNERKDSAGVWVKASERLPGKIAPKMIIRHIRDKAICDPIWFDEVKYLNSIDLSKYEWLDESQHLNNNVGINDAIKFAEWIRTFEMLEKKNGYWVLESQISSEELYKSFKESQPQQKEDEESEKELEERTERNMDVISDFCEHVKNEAGLLIPESTVLSFFNA